MTNQPQCHLLLSITRGEQRPPDPGVDLEMLKSDVSHFNKTERQKF